MAEREWFKGTGGNDRLALRDRLEHSEPEQDLRFDDMMLGVAAFAAAREQADPKQADLVLRQLIADCEIDARECLRALLECESLDDPLAVKLHQRARVNGSLVNKINTYIQRGAAAQKSFNEDQENG